MVKAAGEFDFLLNTIPVNHVVDPYLDLLKVVVRCAWWVQSNPWTK